MGLRLDVQLVQTTAIDKMEIIPLEAVGLVAYQSLELCAFLLT